MIQAWLALKETRRILTVTVFSVILGAGIPAEANVTNVIPSDVADAAIGLNTNASLVIAFTGKIELAAGGNNAIYNGSNSCAVVMFALPDPGSLFISNANLSVDLDINHPGGTDAYPKGLDLYGIRYDADPTVVTGDYGFKGSGSGALIQENVLEMLSSEDEPYTNVNTGAAGVAGLIQWLNDQYDAGAVAGEFVFLRYEVNGDTANPIKIASADHATQNLPTLTIEFGPEAYVPPPVTNPPPVQAFSITSEPSDASIGLNTNANLVVAFVGKIDLSAGGNNDTYNASNTCGVVVFRLPDLGGNPITNANLVAEMKCNWPGGTNAYPKGVDLYGVRHAASASVVLSDYGHKGSGPGSLIQDNVWEMPGNAVYPYTAVATDAPGDAALAAWLAAQYTAGAQPGDYVFLRYELDSDTANPVLIASGDNPDTALRPTLTMEFDVPVGGPTGSVILATERTGSHLKLLFSTSEALTNLAVVGRGDLAPGSWGTTPHSDNGIHPFVMTNLSYSTVDGENRAIYLETTNGNARFYALGSALPDDGVPADDLTQWRSGISLIPAGSNGVDFVVERWYHDPKVDDRGVIYIHDDISIALEHNERNRVITDVDGLEEHLIGIDGEDGIPDSGDEGRIRFFVDMDWNFRFQWTEGFQGAHVDETNKYPLYTAPFSFSGLSYYDGAPVVGATGFSSDLAAYLAQPASVRRDEQVAYWRGYVGPGGEEWHTVTVGDDDFDIPSQDQYEEWSSDGKIFYVVVNPQTPCLQFRTATSSAQFYTTPAKSYFVPKIHDQITYVSEGVSLLLNNITAPAEPMQWRLNDGAWQAYTGPIDLDALGLADDSTCMLHFRIGARPEKSRTLHYKPSYPSDQEQHPSPVLYQHVGVLDRIRDNIETDPDFVISWGHLLDRMPAEGTPREPTGIRFGYKDNELFLPPLIDGIDAYPGLAQYAKVQTLDNLLCLDPIGHEKSHNISGPARERVRHGYYLVAHILDVALNYDALIKTYRYPAYPHGYTAVEDYKVRDLLAASCQTAIQWEFEYADFPNRSPHAPGIGMWDTAEHMGAFMIAMMMPTYDTHYCGTSGADGTVATHPGTPFYATPVSWFDLMEDPAWGEGIYGLINTNEPIIWADRPGYFGQQLMGWIFGALMNSRMNFDGHRWPHLEQAMALAEEGILPVGKQYAGDPPTVTRDISHAVLPLLMNENFPDRAQGVEDYLVLEEGLYRHNMDYYLYVRSPFGWFYIRPDWEDHLP